MCNLELTDSSGNGKNKRARGWCVRENGNIRASITINGKVKSKTFNNIKDAEEYYNTYKTSALNNRLSFKTKQEVDEYLEKQISTSL